MLWMLCVLLLSLVSVASAELVVCFDSARQLGNQFYSYDHVDPSQFAAAADPNCSLVTKASGQIPAQRTLIASTVTRPSGTYPAPTYLKLQGSNPNALAVLMSEAEMQQIDDARAAQQAQSQNFANERANNEFCNNQALAQVTTKLQQRQANFQAAANSKQATIQGQIDALSTINPTNMKQMGTALNNATFDDVAANLIDDLYDIAIQLTRCITARTGGR